MNLVTDTSDLREPGVQYPQPETRIAYGTSFANQPKSIGEIRSDKTQEAKDWSPRDALISVLRDIDSGEANIDALVIITREKHPEPHRTYNPAITAATPNAYITQAMLSVAAFQAASWYFNVQSDA